MKQRQGESQIKIYINCSKLHLVYKLHNIIDKDYEYIKRFKTTLASLSDSHVNFSEKNEMVYRYRGYFGAKAKFYDATMRRALKEHSLRMSDIFRKKESAQKELKQKEFVQ